MDQDKLQKRLTELEEKWFNRTITPEEAREYADWYNANQDHPVDVPLEFAATEKDHEIKILNKIRRGTFARSKVLTAYFIRRVAAAVIILTGATALFFFIKDNKTESGKSASLVSKPVSNDVLPGKIGATLTLANGQVIVLDTLGNGKIANQGSSIISLKNGMVQYQHEKNGKAELVYNVMSTPHGRQFQLELNDGTKVWLNSSSSIKFPVVFAETERMVEVTGEAYFEVEKNAKAPFIVKVNNQEVRVLGTQFNVMAYPDEDYVATTLVEGSVLFKNQAREIRLQPGQQSLSYSNGEIKKSEVDTEEFTAWKNGFFYFKGLSINSVMRQLARWYDMEVEYKVDQGQEEFYAEIKKASKLSDVLKALQLTGKVHFSIVDNKVIVAP